MGGPSFNRLPLPSRQKHCPLPTSPTIFILYLHQVLQSSSDIYMVMPSMATDMYEMATKLKTSGGIAEDHILDMIRPIMDALACLHERGIAHRDVKSENILVDYTPNCDDPQRPTVHRICLIGGSLGWTACLRLCLLILFRNRFEPCYLTHITNLPRFRYVL